MAGNTRIGPLARVGAYFNNIVKELDETYNAGVQVSNYHYNRDNRNSPAHKAKVKKLKEQRGQLAGAILQGRRYNQRGQQQ
jgi:hypothetical protein